VKNKKQEKDIDYWKKKYDEAKAMQHPDTAKDYYEMELKNLEKEREKVNNDRTENKRLIKEVNNEYLKENKTLNVENQELIKSTKD